MKTVSFWMKNITGSLSFLLVTMAGLGSAAAQAVTPCFDPIPNPTTAGWTQEGAGTFQPGPRLIVVDPGLGVTEFKTFRCSDPAMFLGDVVLTPRLGFEPGFVATADGNLGVHVTINDGANQFRAVLFREGGSSVRVRVALPGDVFSPGVAFPGLGADFSMSRMTNGSMVLAVANPAVGGPPLQELFNPGDVPQAAGQNLEFGTYGSVASSSTTNWETLGLPPKPPKPSYTFIGFFQPVDNTPTRNNVKAGAAVPVKFSLNGDQGLAVFDPGYPASQQMQCATDAPLNTVEETVTAGASSLSYDPSSARYTYIWKTAKAWAGSCRRLLIQFNDGSAQRADFNFSK